MSGISVKVELSRESVEAVQAALKTKTAEMYRAIARGTTKAAFRIQGDARKRILSGPKTGRLYGTVEDVAKVQAGGRGSKAASKRVHQASAPGEAPANDTGNLARSIQVVAASPSARSEAKVVANTPYARPLEFGTADMEPRPFLQPAATEQAKACANDLRVELEAAIRS